MPTASTTDVARMREQLFFEGSSLSAKLSRFWLLLVLSAIIASAGVVGDSTATVIGAMIVAPLMVPILGTVVAVVLADRRNVARSLALVVGGAVAVIVIGYVLGLFVDGPVVAATNPQVASRVSPDLVDLVAALATGAVGSVALARDDISDTLPGVAIAISLVPPLTVVGLTFESGAPDESAGALLLFLANVSAILVTGLLVMAIYRVHRLATGRTEAAPMHRRRAAAVIVAALVVVTIPLTLVSAHVRSTTSTEDTVSDLADAWAASHGWTVVAVDTQPSGVVIRSIGPLPEPETASLQQSLAAAGLGDTEVSLELVPSRVVAVGASSGDGSG